MKRNDARASRDATIARLRADAIRLGSTAFA
jgi:hypothetical protein